MKKYNLLKQKHNYPRASLNFPIWSVIAAARSLALPCQSSAGELQRTQTNDMLVELCTGNDRSHARFQWVSTEMVSLLPYKLSLLSKWIVASIWKMATEWVTCAQHREKHTDSELSQKSWAEVHKLKVSYTGSKWKMAYASPREEKCDCVGAPTWSLFPKKNVSSGLKIMQL